MDVHVERSKLIQRHKKEMSDLEKDLKKKKGLMKEGVQLKIEETEKLHEQELADFDKTHSIAHHEKPKPSAEAIQASQVSRQQRDWSNYTKGELEEECIERGLSKKGSKEELITRLLTSSPVVVNKADDHKDEDASPKSSKQSPKKSPKKGKAHVVESDDEDSDSESDSDSDSSSDEEEQEGGKKKVPIIVDDEEAAKQVKRERIVQKAMLHLFEIKFPQGFKAEELPNLLAKIGVNNFKPESLGYTSLHEFARKQPKEIIRYDKYKGMFYPAPKEGEKKKRK